MAGKPIPEAVDLDALARVQDALRRIHGRAPQFPATGKSSGGDPLVRRPMTIVDASSIAGTALIALDQFLVALTAAQQQGQAVAYIEPVAGTIRKYTPEQYESNKDMLHKHGWRPLVYGDTAPPPSVPEGWKLVREDDLELAIAAAQKADRPELSPLAGRLAAYLLTPNAALEQEKQ